MEVLNSIVNNIGLLSGVCFILGIILVVLEIFIPGFGVSGISGCILLILGIFFTAETFIEVLIMFTIILFILGICLSIIIHSAKKGRIKKTVILSTTMNKKDKVDEENDMNYFIGKEGTVITTLRPVGNVDFDGVRLQVITKGDFIEKDTRVKVVEVQGNKIIVSSIK